VTFALVLTGASMCVAKRAMNSTTSALVRYPSGSGPSYPNPGRRHCQFGVRSRRESQRSNRHEFATSPRSSTTWSIDRSVRK
jgi:hypothetical protein